MKKILFLLLFCIVRLSAYEYEIYNANTGSISEIYYLDRNLKLAIKYIYSDGRVDYISPYGTTYLSNLNGIRSKTDSGPGYITNNVFKNYLKNDKKFLSDFYLSSDKTLQAILNYFYNPNSFSANNYKIYTDYELLYSDEGLAVESIVDGVWAGLYDDSQKSKSGALYNKNGSMVYYNGKVVTVTTSFLVWFQKFTNKVVLEAFEEIHRSLVAGIIAAVVLVLAIVRLVLELLPFSIAPRRRRYYGGGRGSLPDYGDGSQVAASVRARLAAKNKALKDRANGGSAVKQSTINGILFDLENER